MGKWAYKLKLQDSDYLDTKIIMKKIHYKRTELLLLFYTITKIILKKIYYKNRALYKDYIEENIL